MNSLPKFYEIDFVIRILLMGIFKEPILFNSKIKLECIGNYDENILIIFF